MSSFNSLFNRIQVLSEARVSPYAKAHPAFGGITKKMRAGGLSAAPLDTIKFIRETLYYMDILSDDELNAIKKAPGFSGKKQAMLAVLQAKQDLINQNKDAIAARIEETLDNFINGVGVNRGREEKYAAQAAAEAIAKEVRKSKSGKELDDALTDAISSAVESIRVSSAIYEILGEIRAHLGEEGVDIEEEALTEVEDYADKISTVAQLKSFIKQIQAEPGYEKIAAYLSSIVKPVEAGLEDEEHDYRPESIEEYPVTEKEYDEVMKGKKAEKDYDGDGEIESPKDEYMGSKDAAIKKAMKKKGIEDSETVDGVIVVKDKVHNGVRIQMTVDDEEKYTLSIDEKPVFSHCSDKIVADYFKSAVMFAANSESSQEVIDQIREEDGEGKYDDGEHAEDAADGAMAGIKAKERLNYIDNIVSTYEGKDLDWYKKVLFKNPRFKDGDLTPYELLVLKRAMLSSEDGEGKYDDGDGKDEKCDYVPCEDSEDEVESAMNTAEDMINSGDIDADSSFEEIAQALEDDGYTPEVADKVARSIRPEDSEEVVAESYTSQYLIEQAQKDKRNTAPKQETVSFKERMKPKNSWQLSELRRYGL